MKTNLSHSSKRARRLRGSSFVILSSFVIRASSFAADPSATPSPSAAAMPPIERISEGVMKVGEVTLDKNRMTVSFAGSINMDHGEMEYLLVEDGGKTHESLLVTKAQPFHIHIAMLLLGAKIPPQDPAAPPPDAINNAYLKTAPKLK